MTYDKQLIFCFVVGFVCEIFGDKMVLQQTVIVGLSSCTG